MDFLPIGIRTAGKRVVIVGGGRVATHKAVILSRFTDSATVIAPQISTEIKSLPFQVVERPYTEGDLDGVSLLFICTGDRELNHRIKEQALRRGILASVCDDTDFCDFISPAIARRPDDNLTIAVCSDGRDVRRSIRVRNRINALVESGLLSLE